MARGAMVGLDAHAHRQDRADRGVSGRVDLEPREGVVRLVGHGRNVGGLEVNHDGLSTCLQGQEVGSWLEKNAALSEFLTIRSVGPRRTAAASTAFRW